MAKYRISKAIGIDLGTTNSAVAILNPTDTDIVVHRDDKTKAETTPSCVWKAPKTGEIVVGRKAFIRLGNIPEPIKSIKRSMGQQKTVRVTDEDMLPEKISSLILKEMKRQIEEDVARFSTNSVEYIVDRAIVTVPAYFDQPQIEATRKAAEMAGLQVLELLHEPTAAACYHCWETNTQNGTFLVYDLGGGTFDVSIVRCTEGEFEVLGISGNNRLGGDDFDAPFAEELVTRLIQQDYDLTLNYEDQEDALRFTKLKGIAEGAKIALSSVDEYMIRDSTTLQDKAGERVLIEIPFERTELEQLIESTVGRTILYCFEALEKANKKAGITLADVDQIILAGGSTHIPMVKELVRKTFCADPSSHEPRAKCTEPIYRKVDTVVALGAAIRAAATGGLVIYNPENTICVSFRGISAVEAEYTYVGGIVEALVPSINLAKGTIKLTVPHMSYEDEQDIKENGAFSFTRIPLQASVDNLLIFEVYDQRGVSVTTIERSIRHSEEILRPTGGSTGTATLAKSITMNAVDENENRKRMTIFNASTPLPSREECMSFFYRADADFVRLPLYQDEKQIKVIDVIVTSPLPKGTIVPLLVEVDKMMNIVVNVKVGNTLVSEAINVSVVPALPRPLPIAEEVQSLKNVFNNAVALLSTEERSTTVDQYKRAMQSYEGSLRRKDNEHAIHEYEQMLNIVSSISQHSTSLYPSKEDFDTLVEVCLAFNRKVALISNNLDQPHDYKKMTQVIKTQQIEGENAFVAEDQSMYTDAVEMLESIREHLLALLRSVQQSQDVRTDEQRAADFIKYLIQEITKMEQQKASSVEIQGQLRDIRLRLEKASNNAQNDADAARAVGWEAQVEVERLGLMLKVGSTQEENKGLLGVRA